MKTAISNGEQETISIARKFAATVEPGAVVCLHGNLGAGKTQFTRGFVQAFGLTGDEVDSPTFTIINEYSGKIPIYHFDCYRLKHFSEAVEIGAEEYLYGDGICIIEWPERILEILPEDAIHIELKTLGEHRREIMFNIPESE